MNHLNTVLIEGVLVEDPKEIDIAESTARLAKFRVVNDRYYRDSAGVKAVETAFMSVQCWNLMADRCLEKMRKGMSVRVVGRLRQARWVSAAGESRSSIEIVADHVDFKLPRTKNGKESLVSENLESEDAEREKMGEPEVLYQYL